MNTALATSVRVLRTRQKAPAEYFRWSSKRWNQTDSTNSKPKIAKEVPGLSQACILPIAGEVGPGASKSGNYKNPEYFCYHNTSYFEAEIEMSKFRLPQPSSRQK